MVLKQIRFSEDDLKAVEAVRRLYGCDTFSQALRLAVRVVAGQQRAALPIPTSPEFSNAKREFGSVEGIIHLPAGTDTDALDKLISEVARRYRFAWRDPVPRTTNTAKRDRRRASGRAKSSQGSL